MPSAPSSSANKPTGPVRFRHACAADTDAIVAQLPVAGEWTPQALGDLIADGCLLVMAEKRSISAAIMIDLDQQAQRSIINSEACGEAADELTRHCQEAAIRFGMPSWDGEDLTAQFPQSQQSILRLMRELGVNPDYGARHRLPFRAECENLVDVGADIYEREQLMSAQAAHHWMNMQGTAAAEGETLQLVSAFRSHDYQAGIIQRKLNAGQSIKQILEVSAVPGFSEHHSGRAIDLTTPGCGVLEEDFENTPAFRWLSSNAHRFGFVLSYPRENRHAVAFEPWHWCWHPSEDEAQP